jgi:hypothetical protein
MVPHIGMPRMVCVEQCRGISGREACTFLHIDVPTTCEWAILRQWLSIAFGFWAFDDARGEDRCIFEGVPEGSSRHQPAMRLC